MPIKPFQWFLRLTRPSPPALAVSSELPVAVQIGRAVLAVFRHPGGGQRAGVHEGAVEIHSQLHPRPSTPAPWEPIHAPREPAHAPWESTHAPWESAHAPGGNGTNPGEIRPFPTANLARTREPDPAPRAADPVPGGTDRRPRETIRFPCELPFFPGEDSILLARNVGSSRERSFFVEYFIPRTESRPSREVHILGFAHPPLRIEQAERFLHWTGSGKTR